MTPGSVSFSRPRATADGVGGFEHGDLDVVACKVQGGGEPVGPAADYDR